MPIAPDCHGDSLTAGEASQAIAAGWRLSRPDDELSPAWAFAANPAPRSSPNTPGWRTISVQLAMDDAANQLAGLAQVTAARLGNSGVTRYR